jgi:hypothetical protein
MYDLIVKFSLYSCEGHACSNVSILRPIRNVGRPLDALFMELKKYILTLEYKLLFACKRLHKGNTDITRFWQDKANYIFNATVEKYRYLAFNEKRNFL